MSCPCHIELILTEADEEVKKGAEVATSSDNARLNSRQRGARIRRAITAA